MFSSLLTNLATCYVRQIEWPDSCPCQLLMAGVHWPRFVCHSVNIIWDFDGEAIYIRLVKLFSGLWKIFYGIFFFGNFVRLAKGQLKFANREN